MTNRRPSLIRAIALVLCAAVAGAGCSAATAQGARVAPAGQQADATRRAMAEYVQRLPPGTAVRVGRASGRTVRGTLMKATDEVMIIQPRTRVPEPPVEVPMADVISVSPETQNGGNLGKAIGIGAAAGAGAALAVFLIIAAIYSD